MMIFNTAKAVPTTVHELQALIQTSMATAKCRKCGCMKETLLTIQGQLTNAAETGDSKHTQEAMLILGEVDQAVGVMEPIEYT